MKNIQIKHAVLATLFLILVVPVFNTSNLYGKYSDLQGLEKEIARYFLGITFEIAIFVCVKAGYRPAGIFFALVSLVIGLLFHVPFSDIRYFNDWYQHKFISSVTIQIGISSMVYFLSELYVLLLKKEQAYINYDFLIKETSRLEQEITDQKKKLDEVFEKTLHLTKSEIDTSLSKHKLEQEIIALQKRKAGMSRGVTQ